MRSNSGIMPAGVIDDALPGAVGLFDQLAIVWRHEAVEDAGRDHRGRGVAAAQFENVIARALQRLYEHALAALQDPQELVDPLRVVVRG